MMEDKLKELQLKSMQTVRKVTSMARLSWGMIQGLVRMGGGAISMTTRLAVSATMGAIQTLTPVLWAAFHGGISSMNYPQALSAMMGLTELAGALSALAAFQSGEKELSLKLRGLTFTMSNMSMMVDRMSV